MAPNRVKALAMLAALSGESGVHPAMSLWRSPVSPSPATSVPQRTHKLVGLVANQPPPGHAINVRVDDAVPAVGGIQHKV
jgi:hypothetical protein